jgi:hypothetical protein
MGKISKFNFDAYAVLEASPSQSMLTQFAYLVLVVEFCDYDSPTKQALGKQNSAEYLPSRKDQEV